MAGIIMAGLLATQLWPDVLAHGPALVVSDIQAVSRIGWLPFLALQTVVVISGVLPASMVGIASGAVYGLLPGLALATVSVLVGAIAAFGLSRSLLRPFIARRLQRRARMSRLDELVARDGWKFVCLLRVSPIMPFAAASYGLGLSSVSFAGYLAGTLAALPALLGYVFVGTLAQEGLSARSSSSGPLHSVMIAFGIMTTLLLTVRIGWIVARCGFFVRGPVCQLR